MLDELPASVGDDPIDVRERLQISGADLRFDRQRSVMDCA
jgi:hypothetical protein